MWVKPTILSSCYHVKIGWILRSHSSYTNYARVTSDSKQRFGVEGAELKLSPHFISHTTADGQILRTRALKVVTMAEQNNKMLDGLIEALTGETPYKYANSTMAAFKLIPFQNTAINRAKIIELLVAR